MSKKTNLHSLDKDRDTFAESMEEAKEMFLAHDISDLLVLGVTKEGGMIVSCHIAEQPQVLLANIELFKADLIDGLRMSAESQFANAREEEVEEEEEGTPFSVEDIVNKLRAEGFNMTEVKMSDDGTVTFEGDDEDKLEEEYTKLKKKDRDDDPTFH